MNPQPNEGWKDSMIYKNHVMYHGRIVKNPMIACPMCINLEYERIKFLADHDRELVEKIKARNLIGYSGEEAKEIILSEVFLTDAIEAIKGEKYGH